MRAYFKEAIHQDSIAVNDQAIQSLRRRIETLESIERDLLRQVTQAQQKTTQCQNDIAWLRKQISQFASGERIPRESSRKGYSRTSQLKVSWK